MDPRILLVTMTLAAPLLAGCLGQSAVTPAGLGAPLPAELPGFQYLCPGAENAGAEPCITELARDDATLQEPYAAVSPADPQVMAVGVNFGPPLAERAATAAEGGNEVCRLGIYVTRDGGATWHETTAPPPAFDLGPSAALATPCAGDPALVFDDAGRLHVTGIAAPGRVTDRLPVEALATEGGYRTFYVRSDDGGDTWGEAVILDDNGPQDRNWITRDPASGALYVVWQNTQGAFSAWTTEVAWSTDGGATWRAQTPQQRPTCFTDGPVAIHAGEVLVSCANATEDSETRVRVYRFDPATGDVALRSELVEQGYWPQLKSLADRRLAMVYFDETGDTQLLWSADGGASWTQPASLRGLTEGAWWYATARWAEADPFGGLHLIVLLERPAGDPPVAGSELHERELRHVVVDRDGAVAQEATLAAWKDTDPPAVRTAQRVGDHFDGIAWGGERALLAFARDAAIQLTQALPAVVTAAPAPTS